MAQASAAWVKQAPFGRPVVPLVQMMTPRSLALPACGAARVGPARRAASSSRRMMWGWMRPWGGGFLHDRRYLAPAEAGVHAAGHRADQLRGGEADGEIDRGFQADEDDIAGGHAALLQGRAQPQRLIVPGGEGDALAAVDIGLLLGETRGGGRHQFGESRVIPGEDRCDISFGHGHFPHCLPIPWRRGAWVSGLSCRR